jgi:hypothetical protein
MLEFFPVVGWVATAASVVAIVMLSAAGELRPRGLMAAVIWLLAAGYCQFFGGSAAMSAIGLTLQTLLAVGLMMRWRFTA